MRFLRTFVVTAMAGALLVSAPTASWAAKNTAKLCDSLSTLQTELAEIDVTSSDVFDGSAYKKVGKAFRKASKKAPKQVKSALVTIAKMYESLGGAGNLVRATAEYQKNARKYGEALVKMGSYYATSCDGTSTGGPTGGSSSSAGSAGGRGGSLTLGDETIPLDSARCYLKEQDAAAGGGKILLTGQGSGTNSDGEEVRLDFTRYDEDSQFTGDDVTVDVGSLRSSTSWTSSDLPIGTVERSGSTLSASDIELTNFDEGLEAVTASFELNC